MRAGVFHHVCLLQYYFPLGKTGNTSLQVHGVPTGRPDLKSARHHRCTRKKNTVYSKYIKCDHMSQRGHTALSGCDPEDNFHCLPSAFQNFHMFLYFMYSNFGGAIELGMWDLNSSTRDRTYSRL